MTPEQKRIAIAEACPTVFHINRFSDGKTQITWAVNRNFHGEVKTVDPLNDLNAMAQAEKVLRQDPLLWQRYVDTLNEQLSLDDAVHAKATVRADAFLLTLGLMEP